jgi:hypothetical protein
MMVALSLPLPHEDAPGVERLNIGLLRRLVKEEAHEFDDAMRRLQVALQSSPPRGPQVMQAWADVIDGMCDIMVVVNNTSNAMGIDLEPFEGWKPPRIREMLEGLVRES